MTQEFDPKKSYLSVKAHEKMIAYVSFKIQMGEEDRYQEGVIKISSFSRPYGGGCMTLTFIIDTEDNEELKANLNQLFGNLTEDSFRPYFGKALERIAKVSLDALEGVRDWYIQEVTVHLHSMAERENVIIEEGLIPAFKAAFRFSFGPVEWWPADKAVAHADKASTIGHKTLKNLLRKWIKQYRE